MSSDQAQMLRLWQSGKKRLVYLTQNDWALITDKARQVSFRPGEKLIEEGTQRRVVYFLIAGRVNILASGIRIAQIGFGETCGEMAFLEDSVASATAVAEEDVKAYAIEWQVLYDLFELFPHLGSRFYRSLAVNLSRRLREQITSKQSLRRTINDP
jgi:extracellular factor (EF) 3-hydroxypalmitic acid methyl ester biosynthesis protein